MEQCREISCENEGVHLFVSPFLRPDTGKEIRYYWCEEHYSIVLEILKGEWIPESEQERP